MADSGSPRSDSGTDPGGAFKEARGAAAGQSERLADAASEAAERLAPHSESLARYAQRLGEGASDLAERLRTRSADQLFADLQAFARRNPTLFMVGAFAAGMAVTRLIKAPAADAGGRSTASRAAPRKQESGRSLHQEVAAGMSRAADEGSPGRATEPR